MKISDMEVTLLDNMGDDLSIVNAARVSFDKESEYERRENSAGLPYAAVSDRDAKLIQYLARHNHWTCFGHCTTKFRIKAPIYVARQLVKHQIGLVWNEVSRRYVDSDPEFYFPDVLHARPDASIKQGSGSVHEVSEGNLDYLKESTQNAMDAYRGLIEANVAPEEARMVLPLNTMTEWIWTGSLAAWARVCNLRLAPHAQTDTKKVAKLLDKHMAVLYPIGWTALVGEKE